MKIDRDTQLALGKMLRALDEADGTLDEKIDAIAIAKVEIDGRPVDDAAARAAFEEQAAKSTSGWQLMDKLEAKAESLQDRLDNFFVGKSTSFVGKSTVGEFVLKALDADPERVSHQAQLEITLVNGQELKLPLEVVHLAATRFLQRASMTAEIASLLPLLGPFLSGGTSLISALASLAASMAGKSELADALKDTATKHLVLAGAGFIPLLGTATSVLAAVSDRSDVRDLNKAFPNAAAVVALRA